MRIKVDENLPREVADLFQTAGHDAITVGDERLGGKPDATIGAVIQIEERALVTLDLDFADIRKHPPEDYAGLVVLRLNHQDKSHVLQVMRRLLPIFVREEVRGSLWVVGEGHIRIRS